METDTYVSLHKAVVAVLRDCSTGSMVSMVIQFSTDNSKVLASESLVTDLSDNTAAMAHLCSCRRVNISLTEFQRVLRDCISVCWGKACCSCFFFSATVATVLW